MSTDFIGRTLGQYRIDAPLGAGGMGQVYRGVHQYLDRAAAIKVMLAYLAANPDFRSRFLREAKASAALRHPNVVEIYEFGEQDGVLYLVMELMTEGSLRTLMRRSGGQPLPLPLSLDLMQQAASGLAAASARGMVHRDIKPDNLLLALNVGNQGAGQYVLKISDFGLARLAESSGQTSTGAPMGTLAYMSPEQAQSKKLDGRSDLYSLGVVLYEVLTGYQPFQIDNFVDALNKHSNVQPRPPREIRPDLPPALDAIVLRCLAKRPEDRYANGAELAAALQGVMGSMGVQPLRPQHPLVIAQPTPSPRAAGTALEAPGSAEVAPNVVTLPGSSTVPRLRVVDQSGQTIQVMEVKSQGITIGRQSGNDIVLSGQGISRQHLQVSWDGRQVTVKDLGSSNGTLLDGVRLIPQASQAWQERQQIHIGSYWIRLEPPTPQATQVAQQPVVLPQAAAYNAPNAPLPSTQPAQPSVLNTNRIGIEVNPKKLTITPGQPAVVQARLTNLGNTVDWFTTTVEGVAPDWVQGGGQQVQLNPGTQENVELRVNVARAASNRAQDYPVTIRARSREKPNESGKVPSVWTVLPFKEDTLRIEPRRAVGRGGAKYTIVLQNGGNAPTSYQLAGEDDEQKMGYNFGNNPVPIEPGFEARIPMKLKSPLNWVGKEDRWPFQVHALPTGSKAPLNAPAEFINKSLIPGWVFPVVGILLAAAIALGALFHVPPFPPATTNTPTIIQATLPPGVTPTPNAQGTASAQSTATSAAATTTASGGQANATATAAATNPYGGTLALNDNFASNGNGWSCVGNGGTIQNNSLQITNTSTTAPLICVPQNANLSVSNFAFQVQMNATNGSGIAFYVDSATAPTKYYTLVANNGTYVLSSVTVSNGTATSTQMVSGPINAQLNNFAIVAQNTTLKIFINQQLVNSANLPAATQGMVGLFVPASGQVAFTSAKVWTGL